MPLRLKLIKPIYLLISVFALLMVLTQVLYPYNVSVNDGSRWSTVWSLVHEGTFCIDNAPWSKTFDRLTIDRGTGRCSISSKPVFFPLWVSGLYRLLHVFGFDLSGSAVNQQATISLILALIQLLPFCLFLYFFNRRLEKTPHPAWIRKATLIAAFAGTYLTGFIWTLNNHLPAALLAYFSFCLVEAAGDSSSRSERKYLFAGILLGLASAHDVPAILLGVPAMVWIHQSTTHAAAKRSFLLGLCIPLLVFAYAEYLVRGSFLSHNIMAFLGSKGSPEHGIFVGTARISIENLRESVWVRILHGLIGHRGIFSLSPIFIFAFVGIVSRIREKRQFPPALYILMSSIFVFALYSIKMKNYGGICQGFRWMFFFIPVWLMFLPDGLARTERMSKLLRPSAYVALGLSIFSVGVCLIAGPWHYPWLHGLMYHFGMVSY